MPMLIDLVKRHIYIGMLFLTRKDGKLESWDLLEATHQPTAEIPVSSAPLTACAFNISVSSHSRSKSFLAVGMSFDEMNEYNSLVG